MLGEITIDSTIAGITVKLVLPEMPFKVAVILVVPKATDDSKPLLFIEFPIVAILVFDDDHEAETVILSTEESEKYPGQQIVDLNLKER